MKKFFQSYPKYKWFLLIYDLISVNLFLFSALILRFGKIHISKWYFLAASIIFVYSFHLSGLYKYHIIAERSKHFTLYFKTLFFVFIFTFLLQYIIDPEILITSRLFYLIFLSLMVFAGITRSTVIMNWMESRNFSDIIRNDVLIYGAGEYGKVTLENILQNENSMYRIVGFIDDNIPAGEKVYSNFLNLGPVESLPRILESTKIDEVIIAINNIDYDTLIKRVEYLRKYPIKVCVASKKFEIISKNLSVDYLESSPLYLVSSLYKNPAFLLFKRVTDIIGAIILLIILSPLLLIVALLVKISSPGPIIFSQIRHGYLGEPFKFYKFRSMYLGAEEDCERIEAMKNFINGNHVNNKDTKIVNEKKVTKIGKFIRKYSIDELPQLFNVLKGEMSLVGPRPMLPYEWEMLKPWHRRRAEIKPGCSGLWQVSGRSKTNFDEMVILDLYYVDNVSPWLDFEILLKTIPTILLGKGGR